MTLQEILEVKGTKVFTVEPDATLAEAVEQLVNNRVGSLVVCDRHVTDGEKMVGIVTERDLLYHSAAHKGSLTEVNVSAIMTREVITGTPDDPVEQVMGIMTAKRIRHLPVLSEGRLVGMVSIGDVVKAQHDKLALENQFMKDYIQS
jgi:CBS domain-containing protein